MQQDGTSDEARQTGMHLRDHAARGFFKQAWDHRVHKSNTARH
jgi:hypothetical protein